jgi:hypothetical protein
MLLRESLFKAARVFSKKEAIVCEEDRLTYGKFTDRVYRLANDQVPGYRERWKSCPSSPKLPCFHGGSLQCRSHGSGPSPDQLLSFSPADASFSKGF